MITDPEAFQELADETRRKMIYLLRVKDMTVSQIAEQLGLTTQAIYHHIKRLRKADMVEVAREERIGHFIETYYRATAEVFHIMHGGKKGSSKDFEKSFKAALEGLKKLGMKVDCSPAKIKDIINAQKKMEKCCPMKDWEDKVSDLGLDFLTQQAVIEYASLASMSEKEFDQNQQTNKDIWKLIKSCVEPPAKPKKKVVKKKKK